MLTNPLQSVTVRLVLYALSLIPLPLISWLAGWGVTIEGGEITIQIEALIAAIFGAFSLTAGIFARFGTR